MPLSDDDRVVELRITGNPDGQNRRTALFQMYAGGETGLQVNETVRTETREAGGGPIQALATELAREFNLDISFTESLVLNLDTDQFVVELQFQGWAGAEDPRTGAPLQWGDTGDDSTLTKGDATGAHPLFQISCLNWWLRNTRISSLPTDVAGAYGDGPAQLRYGQYRPGGVYDELNVVHESPASTFAGADPSVFTGSMTFVETVDLAEAFDARKRNDY